MTIGVFQVEAAIYRLINPHGRGYWAEEVVKLTPPSSLTSVARGQQQELVSSPKTV